MSERIQHVRDIIVDALSEVDDSEEQPFGEVPRVQASSINIVIQHQSKNDGAVVVTIREVDPL